MRRAAARSSGTVGCLQMLLTGLVDTLHRGRVEPARFDGSDRGALETEGLLDQIRAIEGCIYDLIEERGLVVPPGELRLLSEWLRSRTEEVLRRMNARLEALADAVPDRLALHDPAGRLLYLNRAAMEAVGPDYRGRRLRELGIEEALAQQIDDAFSRAPTTCVTRSAPCSGSPTCRWKRPACRIPCATTCSASSARRDG